MVFASVFRSVSRKSSAHHADAVTRRIVKYRRRIPDAFTQIGGKVEHANHGLGYNPKKALE